MVVVVKVANAVATAVVATVVAATRLPAAIGRFSVRQGGSPATKPTPAAPMLLLGLTIIITATVVTVSGVGMGG